MAHGKKVVVESSQQQEEEVDVLEILRHDDIARARGTVPKRTIKRWATTKKGLGSPSEGVCMLEGVEGTQSEGTQGN